MPQTTPVRVHLFNGTHLLATIHGPTARPEPYYTLEDEIVVQAVTYMTVTHMDGTPGLDVQVVPVESAGSTGSATPRTPRPRPHHTGYRA